MMPSITLILRLANLVRSVEARRPASGLDDLEPSELERVEREAALILADWTAALPVSGEGQDIVLIERAELRRMALRRHVRPAYGGTDVPNGGSCTICKGTWGPDEPENHAATCPVIALSPSQPASGEDGLGTPLNRLNIVCDFAEKYLGHDPLSAKAPELTLLEWAADRLAPGEGKLREALAETNALLGCILMARPPKGVLPKVQQQYDDNLKILSTKTGIDTPPRKSECHAPLEVGQELEWQPIETAPKDGTTVDLWVRHIDGHCFREADMMLVDEKVWRRTCGRVLTSELDKVLTPTHWRHVPQSPPRALASEDK